MDGEVWRPVPGYEGWYEVSNYADVRSVERDVTTRDGDVYRKRGRELHPNESNAVTLAVNGARRSVSRYVLAAMAFGRDEMAIPMSVRYYEDVERLKPCDFDLDIDGVRGPETKQAVAELLRAIANLIEAS